VVDGAGWLPIYGTRFQQKLHHVSGGIVEIIGVIIAGVIIGLLGKFVAPGNRDNIPLWLTIICGIGGVLIGWFIYTAFGGDGSPGIDWVRWLIAIAVAAVLVMIAAAVTARSRTRAL
jgi:uncharacterized membrane protein YeaQ/YmgE (transglycosylase-associated protein family)